MECHWNDTRVEERDAIGFLGEVRGSVCSDLCTVDGVGRGDRNIGLALCCVSHYAEYLNLGA